MPIVSSTMGFQSLLQQVHNAVGKSFFTKNDVHLAGNGNLFENFELRNRMSVGVSAKSFAVLN
jgi:hypothetical protein